MIKMKLSEPTNKTRKRDLNPHGGPNCEHMVLVIPQYPKKEPDSAVTSEVHATHCGETRKYHDQKCAPTVRGQWSHEYVVASIFLFWHSGKFAGKCRKSRSAKFKICRAVFCKSDALILYEPRQKICSKKSVETDFRASIAVRRSQLSSKSIHW